MAYEFSTERGVLRLAKIRDRWVIEFAGQRTGAYASAEAAVAAAGASARGRTLNAAQGLAP